MTHPGLSIIIPTYQGEHYLRSLLPALRAQDYAGEVEIVAIDSSSSDGTVDLLNQYGAAVRVIPKSDFTHGYARNLGISMASHERLAFMSQDIELIGDDFLTRLVALLDGDGIGAAYVRQVPRPNATPLEAFFHIELYPPAATQLRKWDQQKPLTLDAMFFSNVCSVTYRDLCQRFPFDEKLVMSEDQYFAKQLLVNGYGLLYSSEVAVVHSHHYSFADLFRRNFDSAYSLIGISEGSWGESLGRGPQYVMKEIAYLAKEGKWLWIPIAPFYELTRALGRIMGRYADHLPRSWRPVLGLHRDFWKHAK